MQLKRKHTRNLCCKVSSQGRVSYPDIGDEQEKTTGGQAGRQSTDAVMSWPHAFILMASFHDLGISAGIPTDTSLGCYPISISA